MNPERGQKESPLFLVDSIMTLNFVMKSYLKSYVDQILE